MIDDDTRHLEERLRDATRAQARSVEGNDLRPLDLGGARKRASRPWASGPPRTRWFVPVVAAAAVIVCAAGVLGIGALTSGPGTVVPRTGGATPPPHYVSTTGGRFTVHDLTTGRVLDSARSDTGRKFIVVGTSADGRNYLTATYSDRRCGPELYAAALDGQGRIDALGHAKVDLPAGTNIDAIASSANGKIAVALSYCDDPGKVGVLVGDLRTGTTHLFTGPPGGKGLGVYAVSLSADGSRLLYSLRTDQVTDNGKEVPLARVLDTTAATHRLGGQRVRIDKHVPGFRGTAGQGDLVLAPDGKGVVSPVDENAMGLGSGKKYAKTRTPHTYGLVRFDLATGKPGKVLYRWRTRYLNGMNILSQDSTGQRFIIARGFAVGVQSTVGTVDHGRFTPLPGSSRKLPGDYGVVW